MVLLILSEVFNLAGAEVVLWMGPGLSGCMGFGTSWPLILKVFLGWLVICASACVLLEMGGSMRCALLSWLTLML